MIRITEQNKSQCCGCNACGDVCSKHAITFNTDVEGFWYPEVNKDLCTDCGLCEKVCPVINIRKLKKNDYDIPVHTIAAINKNMRVRWDSTSGGVFSAFAAYIYEQGGYVGGAKYNEDFSVSEYISNNPEDIKALRSSKYLQSNATGIYAQVKKLLIAGDRVLFCGTPCQMAALRAFLRRDYENLIIVDFVCRGVNSPKVYRAYLDSLERKFNSKVVYVKAKNKELGWRNLTRKVTFENGQSYYGVFMEDDFRRGYHTNVFCRPSCYECQFKGFPRMADITIADFWGIEKVDPNLDNNVGTSMILLNSKKGESFFEHVKDRLQFIETTFETILEGNPALTKSIPLAKIDRESLFADLDANNFEYITQKYFPFKANKDGLKERIKSRLKPLRYVIQNLRFHPMAYLRTLRWNLKRNVIHNKDKFFLINPNTFLDIHPSARITLNNSLNFGRTEIKGFWYPTALKMEANTQLIINDGPLTRYGKRPNLIRSGACIEIVNGGTLTIGQGAANVNLTIMCAKEITIGNGVRIGRNVSIRDYNGIHVILNDTYRNEAPVHIGDHCWLCTGCTIMPGVTIGEGSVVAANSTVTKDVPPHSLVGGSPAKVFKENIEWY